MSFEEVNQPRTTLRYPHWLQSKSRDERVALKGTKILSFSAHMVSPQWLLDCCQRSELVSENDYLSTSERPSDASQRLTDERKKVTLSNSLSRQQTGSFNVDQSLLVRFACLLTLAAAVLVHCSKTILLDCVEHRQVAHLRPRSFLNTLFRPSHYSNVIPTLHVRLFSMN